MFCVGGTTVQRVGKWPNLGHIIERIGDDKADKDPILLIGTMVLLNKQIMRYVSLDSSMSSLSLSCLNLSVLVYMDVNCGH